MATLSSVLCRDECDPALVAFIKCHLTSMVRWNILRVLSEDPGYQWPTDEVARLAHGSDDVTRRSLEGLADEGLVERHNGHGRTFLRPGRNRAHRPVCLPGCNVRPRATMACARSSSPGCSKDVAPRSSPLHVLASRERLYSG